jgi:hypothetical protein
VYNSTTNGGRWTLQPVRVGSRDHRDHDRRWDRR